MEKHRFYGIFLFVCMLSACTVAGFLPVNFDDEIKAGRKALILGHPNEALAHFRQVTDREPNYVNTSTPFKEGVWTFIGRAYYDMGKSVEAEGAFGFALAQDPEDFMGRLYLGLTRLRQAGISATDNSFSQGEVTFALKERITPKRLTSLIKQRGVNFVMTRDTETAFRRLGADNELISQIQRSSNSMSPANKLRLQALGEIETSVRAMDSWLVQMLASPQGRFWDPGKKIRSEIKKLLDLLKEHNVNFEQLVSGSEWLGKALEDEVDLAARDAR